MTTAQTSNDATFVEVAIESHGTFQAIGGLAEHMQRLVRDGAAPERLTALAGEISRLATDGQENIINTGISWE